MYQIRGEVKNGKMTPEFISNLEQSMSPLEGEILIKVYRYHKERTTPQNAYYWGVVIEEGAQELGYTKEELHDTFKAMFLTDISQKLPVVRSTTSLDTIQFIEYVEHCRRTLAELNIFIPDPNQ